MGGLFRGSLFGGGRCGSVKLPPCWKLVTIILESWNLEGNYTHICCFRKYTVYYQEPLC